MIFRRRHRRRRRGGRRRRRCRVVVDGACSGVSEILAPNNFGSALSKVALKGPLKGPLKAVIGRLQLSSWRQCGVIILRKRRIFFTKNRKFGHDPLNPGWMSASISIHCLFQIPY